MLIFEQHKLYISGPNLQMKPSGSMRNVFLISPGIEVVGTQFFFKCVSMTGCWKDCRSAVGVYMLIFEQHKLHRTGSVIGMKLSESMTYEFFLSLPELKW